MPEERQTVPGDAVLAATVLEVVVLVVMVPGAVVLVVTETEMLVATASEWVLAERVVWKLESAPVEMVPLRPASLRLVVVLGELGLVVVMNQQVD
jgi:hypothetical protein